MTARQARKLAEGDPKALLSASVEAMHRHIRSVAAKHGKTVKLEVPEAAYEGHLEELWAKLQGQGYTLAFTTLPESRIKKNRQLVDISW